jgi:hypothetical protein
MKILRKKEQLEVWRDLWGSLTNKMTTPFINNFSQRKSPHKIRNLIVTAFAEELTCVEGMIPNIGNIRAGSKAVTDRGTASVIHNMATTKSV